MVEHIEQGCEGALGAGADVDRVAPRPHLSEGPTQGLGARWTHGARKRLVVALHRPAAAARVCHQVGRLQHGELRARPAVGLVELPRQLRHVGVERRAAPVVVQ